MAALMLCACGGDPRLEFAGNYRGTATFTYTDFNDIMSENVEFIISAPKTSERLVFEVSCEFKAVPTGPDAATRLQGTERLYRNLHRQLGEG